ncbi:MAG: hypothetical protein Q8N96_13215, partial [Methylovulum sp.]|nr:hypothetical protein [Methylovulum sp.]
MQLLQKLFGKKPQDKGIVGISYLPHGIAVAVADNTDNNKLRLNHCEFIPTLNNDGHPAILREL